MKRGFVLLALMVTFAGPVSARHGAICLYADAGATSCEFVDNGGVVTVYIVHALADGATASRFRLDVSATGWSHISDTWSYDTVIGSSINGVSIGYGRCESSPFVIGSVSFTGTSAAPGSAIRILPDYRTDYVEIVDCEGHSRIGAGGTAYVNSATACLCQVNTTPALVVEPTGLNFGYIYDTLAFEVFNAGGGTLAWNVSESLSWLELSPTGGINAGEVIVTVDRTALAAGTYNGDISLSSNAGNKTITVFVTVLPTDPILRVTPDALTFEGRTEDQPLFIFNDGIPGLTWTASGDQPWLSVSPPAGVDAGGVTVTVDRTGLSEGTYSGNVSVTSNGGNQTVPVTLIVLPPYPILELSKTSLFLPPSKTQRSVDITNGGGVDLEWNLTGDQSWLSVLPPSGVNDVSVTVTVDRAGVPYGDHFGHLFVGSNGGSDTITVEMQVGYPTLAFSPTEFHFGPAGTDDTLTVWNSRGGDLEWSVYDPAGWLTRSPSSGTNFGEVHLHVDRTGMGNGTFTAWLSLTSNGGNTNILVSMVNEIPVLQVSPASLSFAWTEDEKYLDIINDGDDDLSWNVTGDRTWMSASPASGFNDGQVAVTIDRTGLADGPYAGSLTVTSNGGTRIVPVDMWSGPRPVLHVEPAFLDFTPADTVATFDITNQGDGDLNWTLSTHDAWIDILPPLSGPNDATVTVHVHPDAISGGSRYGQITVASVHDTTTVGIRYLVPGTGQAGTIAVFSDMGATSQEFVDAGSLVQVHFFHIHHSGVTGSRFLLAPIPNWIHLGDTWNFPAVIGTSVTGVSIGYGDCLDSYYTHLGTANFFGSAAPACSRIYVVADPAATTGQIEVVDCAGGLLFASGGVGCVNSDGGCVCAHPVRSATWGQIKALLERTGRPDPEKSDGP
jgi:hypothetical protein